MICSFLHTPGQVMRYYSHYVPTSGAYCFRVVHPSIHLSCFLVCQYESTGRAVAVTTASVLVLHKMLKYLVKVSKRLYLLNPLMDQVDALPDFRLGNFKLKLLVKF